MIDIEICADDFATCSIASKYDVKRIELCANLDEGGTTPSFGTIQKCTSLKSIEIHVMIRPRPGSFVYTKTELDVMARDIVTSAIAGAKGVVFGCLDENNEVDLAALLFLTETALKQKLEITFHRAFDFVEDFEKSIEHLINAGVNRILTSGGKPNAGEALIELEELVALAKGRIQIMAGAGVNASNVESILNSGVNAIHFTARKLEKKNALGMGDNYTTDENKISDILNKVK